MDILIAGCGTSQAAVFAFTNPDAKVVGVDISQASLDHQRFLKDKYGLDNLELHLLPIEELPKLGRRFDLVVSTGVLMVTADPLAGMKALAECVRQDGAVAIMVYSKYGRFGVTLLQSVFRDLGLGQTEESVGMVRLATSLLGADHPARSYIKIAPDLTYDAGLVDTFLIERELTYSVDECLELIEGAGLVFQTWLLNSPYYAHELVGGPNEFYSAINALPEAKQWSVMDRFRATNGCHFFVACRPDRPKKSYSIDFASAEALNYVPLFRHNCGLEGNQAFRPGYRLALSPDQVELIGHLDGSRSIRQIADRAAGRNRCSPTTTPGGSSRRCGGLILCRRPSVDRLERSSRGARLGTSGRPVDLASAGGGEQLLGGRKGRWRSAATNPNPGTTVQNVAGVQRTLVSDGELELGASDVDAVGHGVRRARAVR